MNSNNEIDQHINKTLPKTDQSNIPMPKTKSPLNQVYMSGTNDGHPIYDKKVDGPCRSPLKAKSETIISLWEKINAAVIKELGEVHVIEICCDSEAYMGLHAIRARYTQDARDILLSFGITDIPQEILNAMQTNLEHEICSINTNNLCKPLPRSM